jgi:hypothetical protein
VSQYPFWSREEADLLDTLAGDVPFPDLVARFQRQAKRSGWPSRSDKAILTRLRRTGQRGHVRCGHELTTGGVAALLGCPAARVEAWLRREPIREILQPRWIGRTRYIERRAWRKLATEMPNVLGGYTADQLFLLLENRELAERVAGTYRCKKGDWRIRCVETGWIYSSCGEAARAYHVTQACISLAIRRGRPVASLGLTFEALRKK